MSDLGIYVCVEWDGGGRFVTVVGYVVIRRHKSEEWSFMVIFIFLRYLYVGLVLNIYNFRAIVVIFGVKSYFGTSFSPVGYLDG